MAVPVSAFVSNLSVPSLPSSPSSSQDHSVTPTGRSGRQIGTTGHSVKPTKTETNRGSFELSWGRNHDYTSFHRTIELIRQKRARQIAARPYRWSRWSQLWSQQTQVDPDRQTAIGGSIEGECSVCMTVISRDRPLMLLLPCRHELCIYCVRQIAKLTQSAKRPRCPFCRGQYDVAHQPPSLTQICLDAASKMLPDPADITQLPDELKAAIFRNIGNKRRIQGDVLDSLLSGISRLQCLDLSGADNLQDDDMEKIGSALLSGGSEICLQELDLSSLSLVSDIGVGAVLSGTTKALKRLKLRNLGQLTGRCFEKCSPRRLGALDITKATKITKEAIEKFLARVDAPQDITFRGCILAIGDGSGLLTWDPSQLFRLDLNGCWRLSTEPLQQFLRKAQSLVSLDVSHCGQLQVEDLMTEVIWYNRGLSELRLSGLDSVSDEVVALISESLPLEHLHLDSCKRVTDQAVRSLRTHGSKLQHLGLSFCPQVGDAEILRLATEVTTIRMLGLDHCPKVKIETLGTINLILGGRVYGVSAASNAEVLAVRAVQEAD